MPRTERTGGQAPNSTLISAGPAIEVRVNAMRADDHPLVAHQKLFLDPRRVDAQPGWIAAGERVRSRKSVGFRADWTLDLACHRWLVYTPLTTSAGARAEMIR